MLNYLEFKDALMAALPNYLPAVYKDWDITSREIVKINGTHEAIHITSPDQPGGSPTIYINELYAFYQAGHDLVETWRKAAAIFVVGMDYVSNMEVQELDDLPKDNIIYVLIPQRGNDALLESAPHRLIMDLALVYRFVMETKEDGINSAIITNEMAEAMGLTEDELYQLAEVNTPKLMPLEVRGDGTPFYVLSNEHYIAGATTMMYPGVLASLAKELKRDLFILPSSMQSVFVLPDIGQKAKDMHEIVASGNEALEGPEEFLADHAYYYHRKTDQLSIPR